MPELRRVCVFCGSSVGRIAAYAEAATQLGQALARRGLGLVYGGGRVGLMGAVANGALAGGAEVIGVIPQFLVDRELGHGGLTELVIVGSMHERKARMAALADAFVALPGGIGTMEELFEVWTWTSLGAQTKPVGLLDTADYYGQLRGFLDHATAEGFVSSASRSILLEDRDPELLLDRLAAWSAPTRDRPMTPRQT